MDLDPKRNYLFGFHPHGVLVAGGFGNFCTEASGFATLFPGLTPYLLLLPFWFRVPFFRDYIMSGGEHLLVSPVNQEIGVDPCELDLKTAASVYLSLGWFIFVVYTSFSSIVCLLFIGSDVFCKQHEHCKETSVQYLREALSLMAIHMVKGS